MSEPYSETQKRITKESVFTALMKLLNNHSYSEISITEITKVAGVSRAAFYRNYDSKEDILIFYLRELFEKLIEQLELLENKNKMNRIILFFSYFKDHKEFINKLVIADLSHIFYEQFCIYVTNFFESESVKFNDSHFYERYFSQFISSGLFRVLIEWIKYGAVDSIEEISQFMFEVTGN